MVLRVRNIQEGSEKTYECEYYKVTAHKHSCFFCEYCTDVWWDYTHGPYMWHCEKGIVEIKDEFFRTGCPDFKEEEK